MSLRQVSHRSELSDTLTRMRNNEMANANKISRNSRAGSAVGHITTNRSELFIDQELTNKLDDI